MTRQLLVVVPTKFLQLSLKTSSTIPCLCMLSLGIKASLKFQTYTKILDSGHLSNFLDIAPAFASVLFSISNTIACTSGFIGLTSASYIVTDQVSRLYNHLRIAFRYKFFHTLACSLK